MIFSVTLQLGLTLAETSLILKNSYDIIFFLFQLQDFIETNYIPEQYESMKKLKNYLGTLKRMAPSCGPFGVESGRSCDKLAEFQFDKIVMKDATS